MPNFSGAAQGYLAFDQAQQERARQAQSTDYMKSLIQQMQQAQEARQSVVGAQRNWGPVLQEMMGAADAPMGGMPPQQPGLPPPPGTPQGGPMPPGVGVASQPAQPPQPPMGMRPGGGVPPPPSGVQFNLPPGGVGVSPNAAMPGLDFKNMNPVQIQALMQKITDPAEKAKALMALQQSQQGVQPFKPMPTEPVQQPQAGGGVPPPPNPAMPSAGPTDGTMQPGQQFGLPRLLEGLKKANVPAEQWGLMLDNLPEPIKNQAANEIKTLQTQNKILTDWANINIKQQGANTKDKDVDSKIEDRKAKAERAAAGDASVQFDDNDVAYWTEVMKNGGSLPPRLAYTASGKKLVADIMHGVANSGTSAKEMLANQAEFAGEKAGQRTLGTRTANIEMAATEAESLSKLALKASDEWTRSGIKSLNDLEKYAQGKTSSPELRRFVAANTSFINAYARAINPQGVGTVADKEHAREMLEVGFSNGDYAAAIDQLQSEIGAAKASPGSVKTDMRERFTGGAKNTVGGTVVPARGTVQDGYRFKGGDPAQKESWEPI